MAERGDPLNLKVKRFDVKGARAGAILTWPERFIPELNDRNRTRSPKGEKTNHIDIYVGPVAGGPAITLHLRNVTVREILNSVSEATEKTASKQTPLGWAYSPPSKSAPGKAAVEYWRLLETLPSNWLEQLHGRGNAPP